MPKSQLGLPLEYQKFPEYFDSHNINAETAAKNALIESLLKENKVKTILDLTCGTGSQVFFLIKKGYQVVGADFSPGLLKIAREKALKQKIAVEFIDGDMRTLKVGTFDAVITIFNAIGHVSKIGFDKALKNIHKNLKTNGIYVFDIFNLEALTDKVIENFKMDLTNEVDGAIINNKQYSSLDRKKGILTSYDSYIIKKDGDKEQKFNNKFSLQIYTEKELKEILNKNGFKILAQYDMKGKKFVAGESLNVLTVAQKI